MSELPNQQNDIKALRAALFETLRALSSKEQPMEVARAQAICGTAQTIINSVKIEIDFVKVSGGKTPSEFVPLETNTRPGVLVHKIK